jgi:hypothetical protein
VAERIAPALADGCELPRVKRRREQRELLANGHVGRTDHAVRIGMDGRDARRRIVVLPTVLLYLPTMVMSAEADAAPSRDMIGMAATARPTTNLAFIYTTLLS